MTRLFKTQTASVAGAVGFIAAAATTASATIVGPGVTVTATNANGSASLFIALNDPDAAFDGMGNWQYQASSPITLQDGFTDILQINALQADFFTNFDPFKRFAITFDVTALGNADTSVTVTAGLDQFTTISDAIIQGTTNVSVTVSDANGSGSASMTPGHGDGSIWQARINGAVPGGGSAWQSLLFAPVVNNTGGTSSASAFTGPPQLIGTATSSITGEFAFTVTADDTATGSAAFAVIPSPGALALAGLGGLVAVGRRRR